MPRKPKSGSATATTSRRKPLPTPSPTPEYPTADRPHIALWPDTQSLIEDAEVGDERARDRLNNQASALLPAGVLPEPLLSFAQEGLRNTVPLAKKGKAFTHGRLEDSDGPMRKLVRRELQRELDKGRELRKIGAQYLWDICRAIKKPSGRSGYTFYESHARRDYRGGVQDVGFRRFSNILSEEKRPLK